jgi:hypothetical protein
MTISVDKRTWLLRAAHADMAAAEAPDAYEREAWQAEADRCRMRAGETEGSK